MRIGEVAQLTGFSVDTLRWYEKIGLISLNKDARTPRNYRCYDQKVLERLLLIKQVKVLGFSLKEIQLLLDLEDEAQISCKSVSGLFHQKIQQVEKQIQALQELHSQLTKLANTCSGNCKEHLQSQVAP